jgi:hypothetical protein
MPKKKPVDSMTPTQARLVEWQAAMGYEGKQKEFANAIGLASAQKLVNWFGRGVSVKEARRLEREFGVSADWLLLESDGPMAPKGLRGGRVSTAPAATHDDVQGLRLAIGAVAMVISAKRPAEGEDVLIQLRQSLELFPRAAGILEPMISEVELVLADVKAKAAVKPARKKEP